MKTKFIPKGVCSREIDIETENNIVKNVKFIGGCAGNTQAVAALVKNRDINEVINILKDIKCGFKGTSCPAQLAKGLEEMQNADKQNR